MNGTRIKKGFHVPGDLKTSSGPQSVRGSLYDENDKKETTLSSLRGTAFQKGSKKVSQMREMTSKRFMVPGDLVSAADGLYADSKGTSWNDYRLKPTVTVIGRSKKCDIVINQVGIAAEHAQIQYHNGQYVIYDCNSETGTYVNHRRLTTPMYLTEKDQISIGTNNYVYSNGTLLYATTDDPENRTIALRAMQPEERPVVLHTDIQTKRVKSNTGSGMKELIRDIRLDVREGSLVAMLGTAGAGKSTVMNCMNGMDLQGVEGSVQFRDVDLVHNFE